MTSSLQIGNSHARASGRRRLASLAVLSLLVAPSLATVEARPDPGDVPRDGRLERAALEAAMREAAEGARGSLDPAWLHDDPRSVAEFLRAHYDPETEDFRFKGPTAVNDARLAREALRASEAIRGDLTGAIERAGGALTALLERGRVPEGWALVPGADADGSDAGPPPGIEEDAASPAGGDEIPPTPGGDVPDAGSPPGSASEDAGVAGSGPSAGYYACSNYQCHNGWYAGSGWGPIRMHFTLPEHIPPGEVKKMTLHMQIKKTWSKSFPDYFGNPQPCAANHRTDYVKFNGNGMGVLGGYYPAVPGDSTPYHVISYRVNPGWLLRYPTYNTLTVESAVTDKDCSSIYVRHVFAVINDWSGPVDIVGQSTDKKAYDFGAPVTVRTTVKGGADEYAGPASMEWSLLRPDGAVVATQGGGGTIPRGAPTTLSTTFTLPAGGAAGTWSVVATARASGETISDQWQTPIAIGRDLAVESIEIKPLAANPNSGTQRVEATLRWSVDAKGGGPVTYAVHVAVVTDGNRAPVEKLQRSDPSGAHSLVRTFDMRPGSGIELILDPANAVKEVKEDNNRMQKELPCRPRITSLVPEHRGRYVAGIPLIERWTATAEPEAAHCPPVSSVVFDFGVEKIPARKVGNEWKAAFDMGRMKEGLVVPVSAYAVDSTGTRGASHTENVWIDALPEFLKLALVSIKSGKGGLEVTEADGAYAVSFSFTLTLLDDKRQSEEAGEDDGTCFPMGCFDLFPGTWGSSAKIKVSGSFDSTGTSISLKGSLTVEFQAGDAGKAAAMGAVGGQWKKQTPYSEGYVLDALTVEGQGTYTTPEVPVPWLTNGLVKTTITLSPSLKFTLTLAESGGERDRAGLTWKSLAFEAGVVVNLTAEAGGDWLGADSATSGGIAFTASAKPLNLFQSVKFDVSSSLTLKLLGCEFNLDWLKWQRTWTPGGSGGLPEGALSFPQGCPRPESEDPGSLPAGTDGVVVPGLFGSARPASAANALGEVLVVYTDDDAAQARPGSFDVRSVRFDGKTWSAPAALAADAHPDLEPVVALDEAGNALAVWTRFPAGVLADDAALVHHLPLADLSYATWTPATGWSAPLALTANEHLDLLPAVAPDGAGGFLVSWASDPANVLFPEAALRFDPSADVPVPTRDLHVTRILPGAPPMPAVTIAHAVPLVGSPGVLPLAGGAFAYVYGEDEDGREGTADDRVLRAVPGLPAGGTGEAVEVARGDVRTPRIAFAGARAAVAWVTADAPGGAERVLARDVASLAPPLPGVPGLRLGAASLVLPADPDRPVLGELGVELDARTGDRIVFWTGASGAVGARLLQYAVVPAEGIGAEAPAATRRALTPPEWDVSRPGVSIAPGPGGSRLLHAIALRDDGGAGALVSVIRPLLPDGELRSIALSHPNAGTGETVNVRVVVASAGDEDLGPFSVELADNRRVVATREIPGLARGEERVLDFEWTVPDDGSEHSLVARVDPDARVAEGNEANNARAVLTTLPDLSVLSLRDRSAGGVHRVEATLANLGVRPTRPGGATLTLDATGAPLATVPYPALAPGERIVLDATPDPGALPLGGGFATLRVRPEVDADPSNDAEDAEVVAAPDLRIERGSLAIAATRSGPVPATLTVRNAGVRDAPATTLRVFDAEPAPGVLPLASAPVPALAIGASATVGVTFPGVAGERVYHFLVGSEDAPELSPSDNFLSRVLRLEATGDADATRAAVAFEPEGLRVTVTNRGSETIPFVEFGLFAGSPDLPPPWGLMFVTEIPNQIGYGGVMGVPPNGLASTVIPYGELNLTALAMAHNLQLHLDPEEKVPDADRGNNVASVAAFSVRSLSHPDPWMPSVATTAVFDVQAAPGRTLAAVSYVLDRSPATVPDTVGEGPAGRIMFPDLVDGEWFLHVRADLGGTWTAPLHLGIRVAPDRLAPSTKLLVAPPGVEDRGMWVVTPGTPLTFEASDPASRESAASGVASTRYSLDGGEWREATGPIHVPEPGYHGIAWRSVDAAGNAEEVQVAGLLVETDVLAPRTTFSGPTEIHGRWIVRPGDAISLIAEDPNPYLALLLEESARTLYRIDGGPWTTYDGPFLVPGPNVFHHVDYHSVDAAGNAGPVERLMIERDGAAPRMAIRSPRNGAVVPWELRVAVDAHDEGAGLARVEVRHEGKLVGATEARNGLVTVVVDAGTWAFGNHRLAVRAVDLLGHETPDVHLSVYVASRRATAWKDPNENVQRYVPEDPAGTVPVGVRP